MNAIDRFLRYMVETGASDFHLRTGSLPMYRRNGDMVSSTDLSEERFEVAEASAMLSAIAPEGRWREFEETGDADFAYSVADLGRFRVNLFRHGDGIGAVLRHIPARIPGFEELGLPPVVSDLCALTRGLVLVTGPTGCGKSTTLASMVDHMNAARRDHIVTIEDPVEFVHEGKLCHVNHREVGPHTRSFRHALRAALRQDPDIILVGEMRDLETTAIAIETAETGHLVLGTLHTTTAASTVDRVIDQFPVDRQAQIRVMLSVSLKAVLCQTLLRRVDGQGRVAALEILIVTPGIANLIREGKTHQIPSAIQTGRREGMKLLGDDLMQFVRDGIVHPAEAYRNAVDRQDMARRLKAEEFDWTTPELEASAEESEQAPSEENEHRAVTVSGKTVFAADTRLEANLMAAFLRNAGIEVTVGRDSNADPDAASASVSVENETDVDRALDLIARRRSAFSRDE